MRRLQVVKSIFCLVVLLLAASTLVNAEGSGAATYKSKCVICHGADGSGNTPLGKQLQAANFRSKDVQKRTDAELQKIVHDGQANMPPFGDQLSDDEIAQVVKYVRSLGKVAKK